MTTEYQQALADHDHDLRLQGWRICPDCKGKGIVKARPGVDADLEPCETCLAQGEVCAECYAPPILSVGTDGVTVGGCWHHY